MKVFNLRCAQDHVFEGWFTSEAEFLDQQAKGWLSCPMCGSAEVVKGLSAPRLARKSNTAPAAPAISQEGQTVIPKAAAADADLRRLQQAWLTVSRHIMAHTEDVGPAFATVARQMHEGDAQERPIRGTATTEERQALADDGIEVVPLILPDAVKHSLQ